MSGWLLRLPRRWPRLLGLRGLPAADAAPPGPRRVAPGGALFFCPGLARPGAFPRPRRPYPSHPQGLRPFNPATRLAPPLRRATRPAPRRGGAPGPPRGSAPAPRRGWRPLDLAGAGAPWTSLGVRVPWIRLGAAASLRLAGGWRSQDTAEGWRPLDPAGGWRPLDPAGGWRPLDLAGGLASPGSGWGLLPPGPGRGLALSGSGRGRPSELGRGLPATAAPALSASSSNTRRAGVFGGAGNCAISPHSPAAETSARGRDAGRSPVQGARGTARPAPTRPQPNASALPNRPRPTHRPPHPTRDPPHPPSTPDGKEPGVTYGVGVAGRVSQGDVVPPGGGGAYRQGHVRCLRHPH
jgi:hypothetical protein